MSKNGKATLEGGKPPGHCMVHGSLQGMHAACMQTICSICSQTATKDVDALVAGERAQTCRLASLNNSPKPDVIPLSLIWEVEGRKAVR